MNKYALATLNAFDDYNFLFVNGSGFMDWSKLTQLST